jgi:hypothetical protein
VVFVPFVSLCTSPALNQSILQPAATVVFFSTLLIQALFWFFVFNKKNKSLQLTEQNPNFFLFSVLRLELKASTLSHSTSPFFFIIFLKYGLTNYLPGLALNHDPPDLCLEITNMSHWHQDLFFFLFFFFWYWGLNSGPRTY